MFVPFLIGYAYLRFEFFVFGALDFESIGHHGYIRLAKILKIDSRNMQFGLRMKKKRRLEDL